MENQDRLNSSGDGPQPPRFRRLRLLFAGLAVFLAAGVLVTLVVPGFNGRELVEWGRGLVRWLSDKPVYLFVGVAILPLFGFPVSPVLLLAGAAFMDRFGPVWAAVLAVLAIWTNIVLGFWLASTWLRGPARWAVGRAGFRLPELQPGSSFRWTLFFRVAPGIPLVVQNYSLGLLGVPWRIYLAVSLPVQGFFAAGAALTGGAILEGRTGIVIGAIGALVVFTLVVGFLRRRVVAPAGAR